jgi:hypothetical protein
MEFVAIDSSCLRAPQRPRARKARPASPAYVAGEGRMVSLCAPEAPDTTYWTAYDYYMAERDARARRRARLYALVAGFARRIRQEVVGG